MSLVFGGLCAELLFDPSFLSDLGLWSSRPQAILRITLNIYVFSESIQSVCEGEAGQALQ